MLPLPCSTVTTPSFAFPSPLPPPHKSQGSACECGVTRGLVVALVLLVGGGECRGEPRTRSNPKLLRDLHFSPFEVSRLNCQSCFAWCQELAQKQVNCFLRICLLGAKDYTRRENKIKFPGLETFWLEKIARRFAPFGCNYQGTTESRLVVVYF